jgi:hypothetical protein
MIHFNASIERIAHKALLRLPESESKKLPSRGQVMVEGFIQNREISQLAEPDGRGGHWLEINEITLENIDVKVGGKVAVGIQVQKDWHEPIIPNDFEAALANAPQDIRDVWNDITPMARWEWVRWINATNVAETRSRRIEASISKMQSGKRRPCCFNLSSCTDPDLSKSGKLIDLADL